MHHVPVMKYLPELLEECNPAHQGDASDGDFPQPFHKLRLPRSTPDISEHRAELSASRKIVQDEKIDDLEEGHARRHFRRQRYRINLIDDAG